MNKEPCRAGFNEEKGPIFVKGLLGLDALELAEALPVVQGFVIQVTVKCR